MKLNEVEGGTDERLCYDYTAYMHHYHHHHGMVILHVSLKSKRLLLCISVWVYKVPYLIKYIYVADITSS